MVPLDQITDKWPAVVGAIFGGFATGSAFIVKWRMGHIKRGSAESVSLAHDATLRAAAVTAGDAMELLWEVVRDTREQQGIITDRLNVAAADIARLQAELRISKLSEARLAERVLVLENHLREAGLPIPPEVS